MTRKRRHTTYKDWITEDGLIKLEGMARDGLVNEQIAHNIGIAEGTLYNWMNKYSEIDEALKKGKEVVDRQVENALLKRALGYEYEEVKMVVEKDEKGNEKKRQEKVIKKVIPDTTAQIFWLRNRKNKDWSNKDLIDIEKAKAEIEYTKEKTKLLKGTEKDTSLLEALVDVVKEDE